MTRKVYRTAQGKLVDLGALQLQNEHVRAVGNMSVNARGDLLDSRNRPIASKNSQVARQYSKQTSNVSDTSVATKRTVKAQEPVDIPLPPEDFQDDFVKPAEADAPTPPSGLAAAIARARSIKQEPLKTPKQLAQERNGVKKI